MRYKLIPATPEIAYVTNADDITMRASDGVAVFWRGPGAPLDIRGPFPLPPFVQEHAYNHFVDAAARTEQEQRDYISANAYGWVIPRTEQQANPDAPT